MVLSKEQKEIIETKESKVLVSCVAAAGKTAVLTERVKYLIDHGISSGKIVVITFTNAAAEEMTKRIGEKGKGVFIGTIHSYANYLLRSYGISTNKIIKDEAFDELLPLIKENLGCIQEVTHLLLDEAQDTDEEQFDFLINKIKPENYFLVGDPRQTIYSWRGVDPDALFKLSMQNDVKTYTLNKNYRNGEKILYFAKNIINKLGFRYKDISKSASGASGQVIQIYYDLNSIYKFVTNPHYGTYKDWFILTRTNNQLSDIQSFLKMKRVPCGTFNRADLSNEELNEKIQENTVKVLTIHTAKGLEAPNVIVVGALGYNDEEIRISYVAATRAKNNLIWTLPNYRKSKIKSWE